MQSKEKVHCILIVAGWRIEGDVHVPTGSRLTDTLNAKAKDFFAITDATVFDLAGGKALYRPEYLAVNQSSISVVFPID